MEIKIIKGKINKDEIKRSAESSFGDMVKIVVDIKREIMAVGGEMHADAESLLLQDGSKQDDLWGANLYPDLPPEDFIEYKSLINIRPRLDNKSMEIESGEVKEEIKRIINELLA